MSISKASNRSSIMQSGLNAEDGCMVRKRPRAAAGMDRLGHRRQGLSRWMSDKLPLLRSKSGHADTGAPGKAAIRTDDGGLATARQAQRYGPGPCQRRSPSW